MDQSMATSTADIQRFISQDRFRSEDERSSAQELMRALTQLERHRAAFHNDPFPDALTDLLESLGDPARDAPEADDIAAWLEQAAPIIDTFPRGATFWLELLLAEIPRPAPVPPDGRVIDVQGWLELFFEPGRHLVVCGMNEGRVPATTAGDPWLGEGASKLLGLTHNSRRAARDAFLHFAMIGARRTAGRVDLICAKSGAGGDTLLPSRLLLTTDRDALPDRVSFLFREVQPPEAGLRWHADWKWQPQHRETKQRLNATSLRDWLACPFRFYLKHSAGMSKPEPDRVEWNQRDFGNVAHAVLETWGRDPEARDLSKTEALEAWFSRELDAVTASWFGGNPPLAVRIQTESLRQRLAWLARVQANHRASGWEVIEVEHKFELTFGNHTVVAKIDRIDRNRHDGTLRVIDYKTGKVENVLRSHLRKITANSPRPAHLPENTPAWFRTTEGAKPADYIWHNLQLPLYACAILDRDGVLSQPCYLKLGGTEADVSIDPWEDFDRETLDAARACTAWIVQRISAGVFWPPSERVTYDDLAPLTGGRPAEECFAPPPDGTLPPNPTVASPAPTA
jgi:ATP-dependent helicase/nuclease subunit B